MQRPPSTKTILANLIVEQAKETTEAGKALWQDGIDYWQNHKNRKQLEAAVLHGLNIQRACDESTFKKAIHMKTTQELEAILKSMKERDKPCQFMNLK